MARFFAKDGIQSYQWGLGGLTPALDGAAAVSVAARVKIAALDGGLDDNQVLSVLIEGGDHGLLLMVHVDGVRLGGRSAAADAFQVVTGDTPVQAGRWATIGGVLDFTGASVRVYRDGQPDGSVVATFAQPTYTPGTPTEEDRLSGVINAARWAGSIEYVALWQADIGDAGFLALSRGVGPLEIQPDDLSFYVALGRGRGSGDVPDRDVIGGLVPTVIGDLPIVPGAPNRQSFPDRFAWRRERLDRTYPAA